MAAAAAAVEDEEDFLQSVGLAPAAVAVVALQGLQGIGFQLASTSVSSAFATCGWSLFFVRDLSCLGEEVRWRRRVNLARPNEWKLWRVSDIKKNPGSLPVW